MNKQNKVRVLGDITQASLLYICVFATVVLLTANEITWAWIILLITNIAGILYIKNTYTIWQIVRYTGYKYLYRLLHS